MRNLSEYPVTSEEAENILRAQALELDKEGLIGDIRPYVLSRCATFLATRKEEFEEFCAIKRSLKSE